MVVAMAHHRISTAALALVRERDFTDCSGADCDTPFLICDRMHILIATTGALPAASAVEFTARLLRDGGKVTVTTVIEVPRGFLEELGEDDWHPLADEAASPSDEDALSRPYVEERGHKLTEPIASGLQAAGLEPNVRYLEGDDPAKQISALADEIHADLVMMGATRQIFDQAAWESVSSRVMVESRRPVLVLPAFSNEPVAATEGLE